MRPAISSGDLEAVAEKLGATLARVEAVLQRLQALRSARRLRAQSDRMPRDPAQGARSLRPGDAGAGRKSRRCWRRRDLAALRRLCGVDDEDLADMIARDPQSQSEARPRLRLVDGAADRAGRFCQAGAGRHLAGRAQFRHAAESAHQSALLRPGVEDGARPTRTNLISPNACRPRPGWCARSTSAPRRSSKSRARSCASRTAFFAHGVEHLRPLNLKTVADAISMHESTVSRVTANKYMATSRGIFELKYFFTSSIAAADGGEAHSAEAVRHRIRQLIDARNARATCSPTTRSWTCCARPASISRAARSRNTAKRCGFRPRCSAGARKQAAARASDRRTLAMLGEFCRIFGHCHAIDGSTDAPYGPPPSASPYGPLELPYLTPD